jgi:hypothetical protein
MRSTWRASIGLGLFTFVLFACSDPAQTLKRGPEGPTAQEEPAPAAIPQSSTPFDFATFVADVQPALDSAEGKGCTAAACHAAGAGNFTLHARPPANGPQARANFEAAVKRVKIDEPEASDLLRRGAEPRHGAGQSVVYTAEQRAKILSWIQRAKGNPGPVAAGCTPATSFNVGVFRSEILPILLGDVDLNRPGVPASTGCAKSVCHGQERPGALHLSRALSVEDNLRNFACHVDIASPSSSQVVACPLNEPRCKKPHPGGPVWFGAGDHNYQRVLSWIYAAKGASSPLDFAFFVRHVQPLFDDNTLGAAPKACSSAAGCHGVSRAGELPPNRSNLPLLVNPATKTAYTANFDAAKTFVGHLAAEGSPLYLHPTNEIARPAVPGSYARGVPHGGGTVIASDSAQARAILTWARGLRVEAAGGEPYWLTAGPYAGLAAVADPTALDERNVKPTIFDTAPGAAAGATWDLLVSPPGATLDLAPRFPTIAGAATAVYAAAYVLNTSTSDRALAVSLTTPNAAIVWAGATQIAASNGGPEATGVVTAAAKASTRILVKLLRRPTDEAFAMTVRIRNASGSPLADDGVVLIKLDPSGGL